MAKKNKREFFVIAHNIHSLHNVGSIFRTADAFGVSKVFLTGFTGAPDYYTHQEKISKVASLKKANFIQEQTPKASKLETRTRTLSKEKNTSLKK
mgnify:CR=1 FL=1